MRQYYSFFGIRTEFYLSKGDAKFIIEYHDKELYKSVPDNRKLLILRINESHRIAHHYYYNGKYIFSIAAIYKNKWIVSPQKIKIIDIIYSCCLQLVLPLSKREKKFLNNLNINNNLFFSKIINHHSKLKSLFKSNYYKIYGGYKY